MVCKCIWIVCWLCGVVLMVVGLRLCMCGCLNVFVCLVRVLLILGCWLSVCLWCCLVMILSICS